MFRGDHRDRDKREFTVFWLDADNRVSGGMDVNICDGLDDSKAPIRPRRTVDPRGCPIRPWRWEI